MVLSFGGGILAVAKAVVVVEWDGRIDHEPY